MRKPELDRETLPRLLAEPVFAGGATRPFGELTPEHVRERADELRSVTGWGPTARVAPIARAWCVLATEMERTGAATVAELPAEALPELARSLWILTPGRL